MYTTLTLGRARQEHLLYRKSILVGRTLYYYVKLLKIIFLVYIIKKMAEVGCLKDGCSQNLQVEGNTIMTGNVSSRELDFLLGNCKNFRGTVVTITDAEADAGPGGNAAAKVAAQMNPDALNICIFVADAAGEIYLPAATANTHLAVHFTGDMDAANALTITATEAADGAFAATTGKYAFQQIGPLHGGGVAAHSVITAGTAASPTSVKLIYTPASATTNYLGVGSVVHFYCQTAGEWMVRVFNVPEGTGATGALTVS